MPDALGTHETKASVLFSNHSEFDNAVNKNRMLAGSGNGPQPHEIGADWVQRYFQVMQGCARAAQLNLNSELPRVCPSEKTDSEIWPCFEGFLLSHVTRLVT
jgi:hypothetical protein